MPAFIRLCQQAAGRRCRRGETEFADIRAAYDALPEAMKGAIDGLIAEHDIFWSRGQIGFTDFLPGEREKYRLDPRGGRVSPHPTPPPLAGEGGAMRGEGGARGSPD